ncbi:MAG: hypothetical protein KZQ99_22945 [Candidatus Thiodiazotropha sp. (ex Dulcina madagascariensis)]|nr:hypothetical protein [Candidatus Thiodiazotropha sp. (ex Dulcina madagascariensis)]
MSGFYLLGLIAIWLFVGWLIYRFWRYVTPTSKSKKLLYYVFGGVLFLIWFGSAFWPFAGKKMYYDAQVREMCAKDGGIKIYETVELSAERFGQNGGLNIKSEEYAKSTDEYYFSMNESILRNKNPKLTRFTTKIIRRSDQKILGEAVRYGRAGGDLPGFWHSSSYGCPPIMESTGKLTSSVFKKGTI